MKRFVLWSLALVCLAAPLVCFAGTLAQFRTRLGTIDVELYDQDKPITVQNFIRYIKDGSFTNNMFFHFAQANRLILGGGVWTSNRFTGDAKFQPITTYPPIINESGVGRFFSNTNGTLAMPYFNGDPNSAKSQFFFNLADNSSSFDGDGTDGYVVFGHVVAGLDVLALLNPNASSTSIKTVFVNANLNSLPIVFSADSSNPTTEDVIYCDVSLLNVQVTNVNSTAPISWNTASNQINTVEYTTVFPPSWQSLTNVLGTGLATNVTDTAASSGKRFYRVRVAY